VNDDWLRLADAARYYWNITGAKIPNVNTLRLWIKKGKTNSRGKTVSLKSVNVAGMYLTRQAWIREFVKKVQE
jgi:hypothetical protein